MILEHHISGNVLSHEALGVFFTGEDIPEPSLQCGSDVASKRETQSWRGEPWGGAARQGQWQGWFWASQVLGNEKLMA